MTRTASTLIVEALACVAREVPGAHARMRAALGTRSVSLAIGGEVMYVRLDDQASPEPAVAVETSVDALVGVLTGEAELLDTILSQRLDVVAGPEDLIAAAEALRWFLEGAVRCLSIEPLADELFALRTGET